jgi:hypothetical protein
MLDSCAAGHAVRYGVFYYKTVSDAIGSAREFAKGVSTLNIEEV